MYAPRLSIALSARYKRPSHCPIDPHLYYFFSSSSPSGASAANAVVVQYLVNTFKLSKARAVAIWSCRKGIESTEKPQSVYRYLLELGFSDAHIQSAVRVSPQIVFSSIEKTLKPKIEFFQDLGFVGSDLGKFVSKNSTLLTVSLKKKLVPGVEILKKVLPKDENNSNLLLVMQRCSDVLLRYPESRLLVNINYFQSCGIVGSQLSMLLKRQPRLFALPESRIRDLVSVVVERGFSLNTRMFVHGLHAISSVSNATFQRKLELICSFGFTEEECMKMFRSAPALLRTSVDKLKLGLEFFLNQAKIDSSVVLNRPSCLMHSMEERVIPRYRVLRVLKSKKLLKKDPKLIDALGITEDDFLQKFVYRFPDNVKDLLVAYGGQCLDSLEPNKLASK